eukprot:GHVN01084581.1.p2 GENE.GHVN01084581.1~~GHVN01084581.1.p2  ORF type:complete len:166 (+),score=37.00 GHVN01084581.1:557-1054(+)
MGKVKWVTFTYMGEVSVMSVGVPHLSRSDFSHIAHHTHLAHLTNLTQPTHSFPRLHLLRFQCLKMKATLQSAIYMNLIHPTFDITHSLAPNNPHQYYSLSSQLQGGDSTPTCDPQTLQPDGAPSIPSANPTPDQPHNVYHSGHYDSTELSRMMAASALGSHDDRR